jgi:hypothetical protein
LPTIFSLLFGRWYDSPCQLKQADPCFFFKAFCHLNKLS